MVDNIFYKIQSTKNVVNRFYTKYIYQPINRYLLDTWYGCINKIHFINTDTSTLNLEKKMVIYLFIFIR